MILKPLANPVLLSTAELIIINSALNEVLNGPDAIDETGFETRIGADRRQVATLLQRIKGKSSIALDHYPTISDIEFFVASVNQHNRGDAGTIDDYAEILLSGRAGKLTDKQKQFLQLQKQYANRLTRRWRYVMAFHNCFLSPSSFSEESVQSIVSSMMGELQWITGVSLPEISIPDGLVQIDTIGVGQALGWAVAELLLSPGDPALSLNGVTGAPGTGDISS